ncbi:hypothetical protein ACQ4PT_029280 [Festuca glaucescens]
MEATAVSLTRTVLDGVLGSAGTAMVDEAALLLGVRREVDFIRSELQMMQSFLRVQSSAGAACKDTVKTCVKQVRDLACDLEDCLLDFTLHASRARWLRWGPGIVARHHASPAASGSSRPASWSSTSATSGTTSSSPTKTRRPRRTSTGTPMTGTTSSPMGNSIRTLSGSTRWATWPNWSPKMARGWCPCGAWAGWASRRW